MNIFNRVILNFLWRNKTRTTVTIIGVILSAAMICAVTTFTSSIYNYALENAVYKYGDWHGSALGVSEEIYSAVTESKEVKSTVYARQIGYAKANGCRNEYKPYIYVLGVGKNFDKTMPIHITSGRYPQNERELILPEHLAENGGIVHKIGDSLTLELGKRMSDGFELGQQNPFDYTQLNGIETPNEEIEITESRTYTVVGFYERPTFEYIVSPGYSAITIESADDSSKPISLWYKMKNPRNTYGFSLEKILSFSDETHLIFTDENDSVLNYSGATGYGGVDATITFLVAVVVGLIVFGSISLIYNAFSISVSERTRQFGLLASVGATKKQLRRMVLFEAFAVASVGIPIGILSGIGGIGITLIIVGERFESLFGYVVPLRLSVSVTSILAAVTISAITVLISVWVPSKRATNVSAVEAIRQNLDINVKNRKVRTSKLAYKIFGLPGMLAGKYYKRSKKKYRATVLSLFMSIVLFVSASAFTGYLAQTEQNLNPVKYDIVYHHVYDDTVSSQELLKQFREDEAVTEVALTTDNLERIDVKKSYVSEQVFDETYGLNAKETEGSVRLDGKIIFLDAQSYEKLVKDNRLSKKDYLETQIPKAIVIDTYTFLSAEKGKYDTLDILKKTDIKVSVTAPKAVEGFTPHGFSESDGRVETVLYLRKDGTEELKLPASETLQTVALELGDPITEHPFYTNDSYGLVLLYPLSAKDQIFPKDWQGSYFTEFNDDFFFLSSDHEKSYSAIKSTVAQNGLPSTGVYDYAANTEEIRNLILIIRVFSYGFILLISLIAAANVFNTISTNINLRRREFAMLKSVGMTAGGFNRMMCFECLLYGSRALLYGLPVSVVVTFLIYLAINNGFDTSFSLPLTAIGIAVFSVFAVVIITMMYSMREIKKENPIDALRNENL